METIPLFHAGSERISEDRAVLASVSGEPLADVSHAPPLLARRLVKLLRAVPVPEDVRQRLSGLARAADLFATADVGGEKPDEYCRRFALATGIPAGVAKRASAELQSLTAGFTEIVAQDLAIRRERVSGVVATAQRVPRGPVLGVIAPSNHPATHGSWLRALAYGLRVAVRPGSRDPITAMRLARAIRAAFGEPCPLSIIHGPHTTADVIAEEPDLALIYGGDELVQRYAHFKHACFRGPGRTKAILAGPPSSEDLDYLARAVSGDAGIRCTNVSVILTDQPPAGIAAAIAERLAALAVLPPQHPDSELPSLPVKQARLLAKRVASLGQLHSPPGGFIAEMGDGTAVMRGVAVSADRQSAGVELPFPFVTVMPWRPEEGVAPARDSLALVLLGDAEKLAPEAFAEPAVRKVVTGHIDPWWTAPFLPHEGHLADFLLEGKAMLS